MEWGKGVAKEREVERRREVHSSCCEHHSVTPYDVNGDLDPSSVCVYYCVGVSFILF